MQWLFLILSLAKAVQCHILANGDSLEVHTVLGGAVTVKMEYPPVGLPIPNCCSNEKLLQQPVLAGAVVTEVAHLRNLGYLLRLDFVENIVTCHLVPDVGGTNDLPSTLCPHRACPVGWNLLQNTCFLVTQVSGSWGEGQTFCQQRGGALATISSNFQQVALPDMLTEDTWIGLRHRQDNFTYGWTDGSEHTYTSWDEKEPSIPETPDGEECVEMRQGHDFLWSAAQCDQSKQYLCSVPGTVITTSGKRNSHATTTTLTTPPTTTIKTTTHAPECEAGWGEYQSSCYKGFATSLTYTQATTNCRALGAYLASIGSEGENSFVSGRTSDNKYFGLSDQQKEGVFTWQDGSPFNYSKWDSGQPDSSGRNENCVAMNINSEWHDVPCGNMYHYVCEKSIQ